MVEAEDWHRFEDAFDDVVAATNRYHEEFEKGFLVWKVPETPPADLDLRPRSSAAPPDYEPQSATTTRRGRSLDERPTLTS